VVRNISVVTAITKVVVVVVVTTEVAVATESRAVVAVQVMSRF
jgi:hypothetical protein